MNITPAHEADNVTMGLSLIVSTRGVGLLPAYTELSPFVCDEPPSEGIYADCRSGSRLQKVKRVAHPEGFAFEIGRVGGSCLEEDAVNLLRRHFIQNTVYLRYGRSRRVKTRN
jgi:hypothetical protein